MKILVLFVDMVRANTLNINNSNLTKTPLDIFLTDLKGINYSNCFSSAPDTGRALGVFATGSSPDENGCNNRVKYPRYFMERNTIFDEFIKHKFKCDYFLHQHNIIPDHIIQDANNNICFDGKLEEFCQNIILEENHFIFLDIQSYHSVLDNYGYSLNGEKKANQILTQHLNKVFTHLDKNEFDDIFIFSDHGFKFGYEQLEQKIFNKRYLLLNEDRTNILMFHKKKNMNKLIIDDKLIGLEYVFNNLQATLYNKNFIIKNIDYIVIEDHLHFEQKFTNIQIWAVVKNDVIYIRTYDNAYLIQRKTSNLVSTEIDTKLDNLIVKNSSSFKEIYNIIESKKTTNSYGLCVDTAAKCIPRNKFLKRFDIVFDFLRVFFNVK